MRTTPTVPPHAHHQHRLDEARHRGDGDVDFIFVEVGDLVEHRIERARLFAHADHLNDHRREDARLHEGLRHVLAFGDLEPRVEDRLFDGDVPGGLRDYFERVENGDAGAEQRSERSSEPRDGDLAEHRPHDRQLEHRLVDASFADGRLVDVARTHEGCDDR